jgi:Protein of unknown function (DUF3833)
VRVRRGWVMACLALGACTDSTPTTGWPFDPVEFFAGHTRGEAKLDTLTGRRHAISVDSFGTPDGHGGLILEQRIAEEGKSPRVRTWTIRPSGPNRWTGTLTDAAGPVSVERTSSDVTIVYRLRNGASVEQHLEKPPGDVVDNHMTVSRFGIRLARLDERIRKLGS